MTDGGLNSELQWIDEVEEYSILNCLYGIVLLLFVNSMEASDDEVVNL